MSVCHGAKIVRNGLVLHLDAANPKSYPGSGTTWVNLTDKTNYSIINGTTNIPNDNTFNNINSMSIEIWLYKKATVVGYAIHPVNKWNTGTTDASFVFYHLGDTAGGDKDRFRWLANRGGTWGDIGAGYTATNGKYYHFALQYNSATGGQSWVNGSKNGSRTGSGILGATSTPSITKVDGPNDLISAHNVLLVKMYSRELSDTEIKQNFEALRDRYGI